MSHEVGPDGPVPDDVLAFAEKVFDLAREGDAERLAGLVDAGVSPDLTNSKGDTLLMLAAYHKHAAVVQALLDRGADPDRVNDRGQPALGAAVYRQDAAAVRALLAAGADPALGQQSGLATARFFDLPEMLALLTEARR